MRSRAIITAHHKYMPFGGEYFEPILDFYIKTMNKYSDEYDKVYFVDSNWNIDLKRLEGLNAEIIRVDPSLRYTTAYKHILPQVKEDFVLFTDNDFVIYKPGIIDSAFLKLENESPQYDVAGILDEIGEWKHPNLNGKTKFVPYFFCVLRELLMQYRDCDWGDNMLQYETLGMLSKKMADDGVKVYEFEEDKSNILFDGTRNPENGKNLGYYHIRAGSVPAVLLAWRDHRPETYKEYIKNQPKSEYVRQIVWFWFMSTETGNKAVGRKITEMFDDIGISPDDWTVYTEAFIEYHCL